jgi:hypothetical protein
MNLGVLTKKGKAICIAPLNLITLAAVKPWGIQRELVVQNLSECKDNAIFCI